MAAVKARNVLFGAALALMCLGIVGTGLVEARAEARELSPSQNVNLVVWALLGMAVLVVAQRVASGPARAAAKQTAEAAQVAGAFDRIDRALAAPDLGAIVDTDLEDELAQLTAESKDRLSDERIRSLVGV